MFEIVYEIYYAFLVFIERRGIVVSTFAFYSGYPGQKLRPALLRSFRKILRQYTEYCHDRFLQLNFKYIGH